ncbi:Panacea domain-containing protein [Corynebacterium hindlerae]|uniref:Panacea domain-containing protein n=1 Tax=Corynebacterium hindlerae TaxID=699041 RepID=UPI003AAC5A67
MSAHTALDIAHWFIAWADDVEDTWLTPLKLQKLVYYAQGEYMRATAGVPLFHDEMQAWTHGPVVPSLYRELRAYGGREIPPAEVMPTSFTWDDFRDCENVLIDVWKKYGIYSAWALRNKTHSERPWLDNFEADDTNNVITEVDMKAYFCD